MPRKLTPRVAKALRAATLVAVGGTEDRTVALYRTRGGKFLLESSEDSLDDESNTVIQMDDKELTGSGGLEDVIGDLRRDRQIHRKPPPLPEEFLEELKKAWRKRYPGRPNEAHLRQLLRGIDIEKRRWPRPKITPVKITNTKRFRIARELPPQLGKLSPQQVYLNTLLSVDGPKGAILRAVACVLAKHSKPDGTPFGEYPSHSQLAREAGVSRSTVRRGVEKLRNNGWLEWKKIDDRHGTRGGFRYFLMMPRRLFKKLVGEARAETEHESYRERLWY
jgi:hypothetical protein